MSISVQARSCWLVNYRMQIEMPEWSTPATNTMAGTRRKATGCELDRDSLPCARWCSVTGTLHAI